jgi:hypothetical protein
MIIKKKTWPDLFEEVLLGKKNFDLRINDFEVNEGDTLILEEYNPDTKQYTGRKIEKTVTYVLKVDLNNSFWPLEELKEKGLVVMSLK